MKYSLLLAKTTLIITCTACLLAYSRYLGVVYCARPVIEGPGACILGLDDNKIPTMPHYVYLATGNQCSQPCTDSSAIYSIHFKPFK